MNASCPVPALGWSQWVTAREPAHVLPRGNVAKEVLPAVVDPLYARNGCLGALLFVNGQIKPTPLPYHFGKSKHQRSSKGVSWDISHSTESAVTQYEKNSAGQHVRPNNMGLVYPIGWALLFLSLGGLIAFYILGFYQINHRREQIQWARQLQTQEQENQRLKREQRALLGYLAVQGASDKLSEIERVNFIPPEPRASIARPGL